MKIAPPKTYNFSDERLKRESAREFICQYLDSEHVDLVMKCAYELNLSTEEATAYALAMFNAIQDMFYFHMDLKLGEVTVKTIRTSIPDVTTVKDKAKIFFFREFMQEPYITNRSKARARVVKYLVTQTGKKARLLDKRQKFVNAEKYAEKKEKQRKKRQKETYVAYREKQKRIKKRRKKNIEWYRFNND